MVLDKFLVNIVDQLSALKMRGASKVFRMIWWKILCNTITWYEWASQEINKLLNKKLESFITAKKKNYSQEFWLSLPNILFTCVTYFLEVSLWLAVQLTRRNMSTQPPTLKTPLIALGS